MAKDKADSLVFKNIHLLKMMTWLQWQVDPAVARGKEGDRNYFPAHPGVSLELKGRDARNRNKFIRLIQADAEVLDKERVKLLENNARKDKDGKPMKKKNDPQNFDISSEGLAKFLNEYNEVLEETFTVDILPSNELILKSARDILNKLERAFDTREGVSYDEIMEEFDKLEE